LTFTSSLTSIQLYFIEDFEGMVQGVGYDQVYGRIFGILWVSDKEKSLDEICKESSYALSTVSIVLKEM